MSSGEVVPPIPEDDVGVEWFCRHCDAVYDDPDDLQQVQPDGHFACPMCLHDDLVSRPPLVDWAAVAGFPTFVAPDYGQEDMGG